MGFPFSRFFVFDAELVCDVGQGLGHDGGRMSVVAPSKVTGLINTGDTLEACMMEAHMNSIVKGEHAQGENREREREEERERERERKRGRKREGKRELDRGREKERERAGIQAV